MSKHFVSGAVALLMVLTPVVASAFEIPQVPPNPTIEQLQALVVQLTAILQELLAQKDRHVIHQNVALTLSDPLGAYSIGDSIDVTAGIRNAPIGSSICSQLQRDGDNVAFSFPPTGACIPVGDNSSAVPLSGVIISNAGYNVTPGTYHLSSHLIAAPDASGKEGVVLASAESRSFQIVAAEDPLALPSCIMSADKMTVAPGETFNLTWNTANMPTVALTYQSGNANGALTLARNGSMPWVAGSGSVVSFKMGQGSTGSSPLCALNVNVTAPLTPTTGTLIVSTDSSSPSFQTVAGGSTNVTSAVYKFRSTGENVYLSTIGLKLTSGVAGDIVTVHILSSQGNELGQAVFTGNNTSAAAVLYAPLTIGKDSDTAVIVKADYAKVGISQPGVAGDIVRIDVDASQTMGTGVTSTSNIVASGSTSVAGVQLSGASAPGALTFSTDPSSPSYMVLPGATTGVLLGVYKVRATGEDILLNKIGLKLTSGKAADLGSVYIYGAANNLIGTTVFPTTNVYATSSLFTSLALSRDTDSSIVIRGDLASTDLGQAATPGDVIKVDFANATGNGAQSGSVINASGSTNVAGVGISERTPVTPSCTVSYSPNLVTKGGSLPISWTSQNAVSRTYKAYDSAGNMFYASAQIPLDGTTQDTSYNNLAAGVYTRIDTVVSASGLTATCTATLTVQNAPIVCPVYQQVLCPSGQHYVADATTYDANNCAVPHSHCVADAPQSVSCTFKPVGSLSAIPSFPASPSTISTTGGQSACSSWCASQGASTQSTYVCIYNGQSISMTAAQRMNVANALTAIENILQELIRMYSN